MLIRIVEMKYYPLAISLAVILFIAQGCSRYDPNEHRVQTQTARETLELVLKSWQEGNRPESWQEKKPAVVVQDMDWKSGARLKSFEIVGEGEAIDANLYCQVKLNFEQPQNGKREHTVTYLVGTSPVLTVFRSPGP